jgi:hypothetical protein
MLLFFTNLVTPTLSGFDFFSDRDRIKCENGESSGALLKIEIPTTTTMDTILLVLVRR